MLLSTPPLLSTIFIRRCCHLAQMVGLHLLPHLRLERTLLKWTLPNKIARRVVATYQNFYLRTTGGPATDLARVMPDHRRVMTGRSPSVWNRAAVISRLFVDPTLDHTGERITAAAHARFSLLAPWGNISHR